MFEFNDFCLLVVRWKQFNAFSIAFFRLQPFYTIFWKQVLSTCSAAFPGQGINGISVVVVSCLVFTGVYKVIVCRGVYNCLVLAREIFARISCHEMQEILEYLVCVCWLDLVGWTGGETSWLVSTWAMCGLGSFSVHLGIAEALVGERFVGFWVLTQNYLLKHINLQHS